MSKTSVDLDDAMLERAQELSGISTEKGVIAAALEQMVRRLELDERARGASGCVFRISCCSAKLESARLKF